MMRRTKWWLRRQRTRNASVRIAVNVTARPAIWPGIGRRTGRWLTPKPNTVLIATRYTRSVGIIMTRNRFVFKNSRRRRHHFLALHSDTRVQCNFFLFTFPRILYTFIIKSQVPFDRTLFFIHLLTIRFYSVTLELPNLLYPRYTFLPIRFSSDV